MQLLPMQLFNVWEKMFSLVRYESSEVISEVCQKSHGNLNSSSCYFKEGKRKGEEFLKRHEREEVRNRFESQSKSS